MEDNNTTPAPGNVTPQDPATGPAKPAAKRRRMSRWIRIPLVILLVLLVTVLLIPVALYIPAVQTAVKNVATGIVRDKTGMDIGIGKLRLKFPLDLSLEEVHVVEAQGDTMVRAREVIADVRLMPLLKLDVRINRLRLLDGYYRMVSPDSSMIMKVRAGLLEVDDRSSMDIRTSRLLIHKARLADGDVALYMNVWRQQQTPKDSTSTPFYIQADMLDVERIRFGMSMLPTIDTLMLDAGRLSLRDGVIDLASNDITASLLQLRSGSATYIAPTPEYVAAHPAPAADSTSAQPASPPMTIRADSISLDGFSALYTTAGARPLPGFDAGYIQVSDLAIGLRHFFNRQAALRLPVTRLSATERSGLKITRGTGTVALDSAGIKLDALDVSTPFSHVAATADVPFALMQLQPSAPVEASLDVSVGITDINSFMPSLAEYTRKLPGAPLIVRLAAEGRLDNVDIKTLDLRMPGSFTLSAYGTARNALDMKNLVAEVTLEGAVDNPGLIRGFVPDIPFDIPRLYVEGTLGADHEEYSADIGLVTPKGSLVAEGRVGLNSEAYRADLRVTDLDVDHFMPDLGIGRLTATVHAAGAGFNPTLPKAHTDFDVHVASIVYNKKPLRDITLSGRLASSAFIVDLDSPNPDLNLNAHITGTLRPDDYCAEGLMRVYNADLMALGFMEDTCYGAADLEFDVTARPSAWLYDANMQIHSVSWHLPTMDLDLPDGLGLNFIAEADNVSCDVTARKTALTFESPRGLEEITASFTRGIDAAMAQIRKKDLDIEELQHNLPPFTLDARASGAGLMRDLLEPHGMYLDTLSLSLSNDSLIHGDILARRFMTSGMTLDTITLALNERGKLMDYRFHLGNRPGTLDEFARVNLNGYVGSNRLSAFLNQQNLAGETGYRLGFTAGFANDSIVSLHFTPLKSTIAYLPWTFNEDNHIDYQFSSRRVNANLRASSNESSLLIMTEPAASGEGDDLHLNLTNIKVQDFLRMSITAPPLLATVNGDLRVHYDGKTLSGKGDIGVTDLYYDRMRVGDLDLRLNAGVDLSGDSNIEASLKVDGHEDAMVLSTVLAQGTAGLEPKDVKLALNSFPLSVANPFLGADVASLSGGLTGSLSMAGSLTAPVVNGSVALDSVGVRVPMIGSTLKLRGLPLSIKDNVLDIPDFNVFGANANPLHLQGTVDATSLSGMKFDLKANASNFQVINTDRRSGGDLYGKLFLNLDASVKGPMQHFDVTASASILNTTDVTYVVDMAPASALGGTSSADVVKFVNFADTVQTTRADSIAPPSMAMRIKASLNIVPGTHVAVDLGGQGKAELAPSGTLTYNQNFMGDMTVNGQLFLGEGFVTYKVPVMGTKTFHFDPQSSVTFNGDMMNPTLDITATDYVKTNIINSSGNSNLIDFLVTLDITDTLASPGIAFDLSTDDDMTVKNELQSMTPDQRAQQAMYLLMTGQYSGAGTKTASSNLVESQLYGLLENQLNNLASKVVKGVDLSFGIDNYNKTTDGSTSNTTSYSYQMSKSLFSNRFKIVVGGNYSTDTTSEDDIAQNLVSDISFEYTLKQTNTLTMLVRLFRHMGYESVLEGEVTEMGVGFAMRRRLSDLRRIFRVHWGKSRREREAEAAAKAAKEAAAREPEDPTKQENPQTNDTTQQ